MKTKVFALVPYSVPAGEMNAYIQSQLEKHPRNESNLRRNGRFDYLVGPLETLLSDGVTEGRLPPETHRIYHRNTCEMNRLPFDATAGAIVTPDGIWHDLSERIEPGESRRDIAAGSSFPRFTFQTSGQSGRGNLGSLLNLGSY